MSKSLGFSRLLQRGLLCFWLVQFQVQGLEVYSVPARQVGQADEADQPKQMAAEGRGEGHSGDILSQIRVWQSVDREMMKLGTNKGSASRVSYTIDDRSRRDVGSRYST